MLALCGVFKRNDVFFGGREENVSPDAQVTFRRNGYFMPIQAQPKTDTHKKIVSVSVFAWENEFVPMVCLYLLNTC